MSHIHFTTTNTYRNKILKMGENSKNVLNFGSLALPILKIEDLKLKMSWKKNIK